MIKQGFILFFLSLILPGALALNFFVAQKTLWEIYPKAWLIYSLLLLSFQYIIFSLLYLLIKKITPQLAIKLSFFKLLSLLLAGNFYFIAPRHTVLWYEVPIFSVIIIFAGSLLLLKEPLKNPENPQKSYFTNLTKDTNLSFKKVLSILMISLFLGAGNLGVQYITVHQVYNPYHKSLEYFMGPGVKVKVDS